VHLFAEIELFRFALSVDPGVRPTVRGIRYFLPSSGIDGFHLTYLLTAPARPLPQCPCGEDYHSVLRFTSILSRRPKTVKIVVHSLSRGLRKRTEDPAASECVASQPPIACPGRRLSPWARTGAAWRTTKI